MSLAFREAFREEAVGRASKGWLDDTSGRGLSSAPRSDVRSCLLPDHLSVRMAFEVEEAFMLAGVFIGEHWDGIWWLSSCIDSRGPERVGSTSDNKRSA